MDQKLIDKVLSKSATPEEARSVAAWFATDEGQEYLSTRFGRESYLLTDQILDEWLDHQIPTEQMKSRFLSHLSLKIRSIRFRVAAAVLIPFLFMVATATFIANRAGFFQATELAEFVVPCGEQLNLVLQDGTQVQLNSGSKLQYPKKFGFFSRKVKLTGEAYFKVAKEIGRPFEVDLNDIKVKVTGTQFNVKAYGSDKTISVALQEGSVNIADSKNNIYPMKVGESAEFDKQTGICKVMTPPDMSVYTAWRTRSLNFYRTPLSDIIKTLERQYEVQFLVTDSSLLANRFSISTSKINVDEIILDLQKVSRIKITRNPKNIFIVSAQN